MKMSCQTARTAAIVREKMRMWMRGKRRRVLMRKRADR